MVHAGHGGEVVFVDRVTVHLGHGIRRIGDGQQVVIAGVGKTVVGDLRFEEETEVVTVVMIPTITASQNPLVRADMVFFETANGGAVFSSGSIAWAVNSCPKTARPVNGQKRSAETGGWRSGWQKKNRPVTSPFTGSRRNWAGCSLPACPPR